LLRRLGLKKKLFSFILPRLPPLYIDVFVLKEEPERSQKKPEKSQNEIRAEKILGQGFLERPRKSLPLLVRLLCLRHRTGSFLQEYRVG